MYSCDVYVLFTCFLYSFFLDFLQTKLSAECTSLVNSRKQGNCMEASENIMVVT